MILSLLITPLLGVIGVILSGENSSLQKKVALASSLLTFVLSLVLWAGFDSNYNGFQFVSSFPTITTKEVVGVDGISLFFVLLTTFIIPICILSSWDSIKTGIKYFLIAFLVLETLLIAVFVVLDLLLFYICFESVLIPMFLIIGIWGARERKIHAAYQFFLYTLLGSLFMLLAILVIYFEVGSTDYQVLAVADISETRQRILWLGFFLSFAVKVPMIPFHIWLPEAHVEASLAGSIILAGILLKLAGYGFLRYSIGILPDASVFFTPLVYSLAVISIIYSSFTTLRQIDLKKIIAYSSVGHMNITLLGLFSNTIQGIEGSLILMLAHGVVSPALFICVVILYDRYHTRLLKYYRGLTLHMPVWSIMFFFFTLGNIAVPLSANFVGEFMTFTGAYQQNPVLTVLGALAMILSAGYGIWLYNRTAFGAQSRYLVPLGDMNRREFMTLLPLLILMFVMGVFPNIFLEPMHLAVSNLLI
ncbi:NADH dehydrogenase subunit 4 [Dichotomocladium elegans]|nr:NADH dehydrogenase subunit 4 [Dichotomocladium elegans]KAI9309824.1 NADH dehydrogenase subunit 4 [Dichotomocladium elegans]KAI9309851.1 NADH dehydrogenase subunit 4 [Dichotomocladium elegans]